MPNQFNGTVLLGEEWRDNAQLRYNLFPLGLPEKCDGCGVKLCVEHALSCKVGGMVHIQHDNVAQEFVFYAVKLSSRRGFPTNHSSIHVGPSLRQMAMPTIIKQMETTTEQKG